MKPLKIDLGFQSLIPPLSDDELHGLEESILAEGRRDTIKVWKGTIVDGHNRYAICQKHGITPCTQEVRFTSKKNAELWIVQNQLGRRNLTNAMRIKLALHKENLLAEKAKRNRKGSQGSPVHVRKTIAKEANVSEQTVYKYMKIRELGSPELLQQVEAGEIKIGTAHRGLEVTTRTVECLFSADDIIDIGNPYCRMALLGNVGELDKMVVFLSGDADLIKAGGGMLRVLRRLRTLVKDIQSLL